jgi:UDP-N-acetylglucosamine 2-epimerase (non-hydrolysing)
LAGVAHELPVVLPIHPRTRKSLVGFGLEPMAKALRVVSPLGYRDMVSLLDGAGLVLTDSGGIQEETTALGVPCVTLRQHTERPVTLTEGTNRLAPWPLSRDEVVAAARAGLDEGRRPPGTAGPEGWDGRAAERIVRELAGISEGDRSPEPGRVASLERAGTGSLS